jgi:hypothetical protein
LYEPARVPLYKGGAISMKYSGAAVEAKVEKNESRNRPPTKVGMSFAVLVTIVPVIPSISHSIEQI